jgi:hypothetical protein
MFLLKLVGAWQFILRAISNKELELQKERINDRSFQATGTKENTIF